MSISSLIRSRVLPVVERWINTGMQYCGRVPRSLLLVWAVIAICATFWVRLAELQLLHSAEFQRVAARNRTFSRYTVPPRGVFLDRNGVRLVENEPIYRVATEESRDRLYPVFEETTREDALVFLQDSSRQVIIDQRRVYRHPEALMHVLGYIGEVTQEELQANTDLRPGRNIGKTGLEALLESQLAGTLGVEQYEMHATGKLLEQLSVRDARPGESHQLQVDAELSQRAYELLDGRKGAVVVMDPRDGSVLSMVSSPAYSRETLVDAIADDRRPLINRAIHASYPPGSIFKMIPAIAALESGRVQVDTEIEDTGVLKVGDFEFRNWLYRQYGRTDGMLNVVGALRRSNDIYFYKIAEFAGIEQIARTAGEYGLGKQTGIELAGERAGLVPTPAWKQQRIGEPWYLGNTYHVGIGQGDLLMTPLQAVVMTGAIGTGEICTPRLLSINNRQCTQLDTDPEILRAVREGMRQAVEPGGTAYPFFDGVLGPVAGKTGTSEFGPVDDRGRRSTHAWFVAFAPVEEPSIAIAVFLEAELQGTDEERFLEGSHHTSPIAKELLQFWQEKNGL